MTSHRGSGSTVLRAPDRPACPVETASISVGSAAEADGAPYVPDHWSISWPTGRVPGRMRRQTPDGRALEALVLFYEFVRASIARPSSHLPAKARCESRRGEDEACLGTFKRFAQHVHPLGA